MCSQCDPTWSSREIHSDMGPLELGCPSALRMGMGLANFLVKRLCSHMYLISIQNLSHPLSTSACTLCSDWESRIMILVLNSSFIPFVSCMKHLEFLSSSIASIALVSPSRLISSMVCWFISFCCWRCDQTFNMGMALLGSSLSCAATQDDVKRVNHDGLWSGRVYRFSYDFTSIRGGDETESDWEFVTVHEEGGW